MRAKTNAERRLFRAQALADRGGLIDQPGIGLDLVNADRAAQHDQQIAVLHFLDGKRLNAGREITNLEAKLGQEHPQNAQILEGDMANDKARPTHAASPAAS